jgi:hypothetical protein
MRLSRQDAQRMFFHDRRQQLGMLCLLLLLFGKSVTTAGYSGCINNCLRTFRGVLGIIEDNFIWTVGTSPQQRVLASRSTFLSANHPLRSRLFHVCLWASSSKVNITSQIFTTVVKLLRGVEMNHILLIDYYLFNKYPEISRIRAVRDNVSKYSQAVSYLASLPTDGLWYVKLIRPRSDTNVLNRNNFVMLSSAPYTYIHTWVLPPQCISSIQHAAAVPMFYQTCPCMSKRPCRLY